jgi:hypothetical protein
LHQSRNDVQVALRGSDNNAFFVSIAYHLLFIPKINAAWAQRFFLPVHVTSMCHTRMAIFPTGISYLGMAIYSPLAYPIWEWPYIPHWHILFENGYIFPTSIGHLEMAIYFLLVYPIWE